MRKINRFQWLRLTHHLQTLVLDFKNWQWSLKNMSITVGLWVLSFMTVVAFDLNAIMRISIIGIALTTIAGLWASVITENRSALSFFYIFMSLLMIQFYVFLKMLQWFGYTI